MASLKKHRETLLALIKANPPLVKKIVQSASPSLIKALSELALNTLQGTFHLPPSSVYKLKKFKSNLRILADRSQPTTKKKQTLQKGGFLPLLASIAAPLLIEGVGAIAKAIKKKKRKRTK